MSAVEELRHPGCAAARSVAALIRDRNQHGVRRRLIGRSARKTIPCLRRIASRCAAHGMTVENGR